MSITLTDTPLLIGDLELANRTILAPLTRGRCGLTQVPKEHVVTYYTQRAEFGLIISEATVISPQGMGWSGAPAIYNASHSKGGKR